MTQLILEAHVSKLDISADVESTKLTIEKLEKGRSEAMESSKPRPISEHLMDTLTGVLKEISLEITAKKGELAELVKSQKAAESKIMELHKGFVYQVKSGPKL